MQYDPVTVLAAVIEQGGRWLVARRPALKAHGGKWEFPGGKVELGEDVFSAVGRELAEELGVLATAVGNVLFSFREPDSPFFIHFVAVKIEGDPAALEHDEVRWVTIDEIRTLDLAPADAAFVSNALE